MSSFYVMLWAAHAKNHMATQYTHTFKTMNPLINPSCENVVSIFMSNLKTRKLLLSGNFDSCLLI